MHENMSEKLTKCAHEICKNMKNMPILVVRIIIFTIDYKSHLEILISQIVVMINYHL